MRKSPLFHLSLSSKELFHSNFIAWLCESHHTEDLKQGVERMLRAMTNNGSLTLAKSEGRKVRREFNNLDLVVSLDGGGRLIIENKVKSLPDRPQLEEYAKKCGENDNPVLLSIVEPDFFEDGIFDVNVPAEKEPRIVRWRYVSYRTLVELLKEMSADLQPSYDRSLIEDYCAFTSALVEIVTLARDVDPSETWDWNGSRLSGHLETLQRMRIADIVQKVRAETIARYLRDKLSITLQERCAGKVLSDWTGAQTGDFVVNSGMTRGTGLVELFYVLDQQQQPEKSDVNRLCLGIQIQGNDYRIFVHAANGEAETTAERLYRRARETKGKQGWFYIAENLFPNSIHPERPTARKDGSPFNRFRTREHGFFYRSRQIDERSTVSRILDNVIDVALRLPSERDELLAIARATE